MKPGSQSDILRNVFTFSSPQSSHDDQTKTHAGHDATDPDFDEYNGEYDNTWSGTDVQDPQADEVAGSSSNSDGGSDTSDKQRPQTSSSSSGTGGVRPPKVAPAVSGNGGGAGGTGRRPSGSTRPRPRPEKKCRSVPVVYSGETVVRLGQICYEVPPDGS